MLGTQCTDLLIVPCTWLHMVDPILNHFKNSIKNVTQQINNANDIFKLYKKCYLNCDMYNGQNKHSMGIINMHFE